MRYLKPGALLALAGVVALVVGVASAPAVESPAAITVTKTVVGPLDSATHEFGAPQAYYKAGDTVTYKYVVAANDRFVNVSVVDDNCSPVQPVMGVGSNTAHNIGDVGYFDTSYHQTGIGDGVLNGYAGEKWQFYCTKVLPAVNPSDDVVNTATADAVIYGTTTHRSDTDTYRLQAAVLRKAVALYWSYSQFVAAPGSGDQTFAVDLYKDAVKVGTENVSANTPLAVYLMPGTWSMTEQATPAGYSAVPGRTSWDIGTLTVTSNPRLDNTIFNLANWDLAIAKSGPDYTIAGNSITYTYTVTNAGPGAPTPVVTDDKCSPVSYASGDTNSDGYIEPAETWQFTCTTTPVWSDAFPNALTNTASVAAETPSFTPVASGSDSLASNDTATFSLYPFVLRKDVQIYNDGSYLPFDDNTTFNVNAYLGTTLKGSFTVSENSPTYLWLAAGTWKFQEYNLASGYFPFYSDSGAITYTSGTYPDWTEINITWSGCSFSHGYWKNHIPWPGRYTPTDLITSVFSGYTGTDKLTATLQTALEFPGGPGTAGAQRILLRAAVGMLLNEAKYGPAFGPYTSIGALVDAVNSALGSDRDTMLALADSLQAWNGGICR